jgi:ribosome recycling factor
VRREANKALDTAEKDKTISEDDRDTAKDEIQELTKKFENQVSDLAKARESDVMEQ